MIYLLENLDYPRNIKAGRTNDLARRVSEHNRYSSSIGQWAVLWVRYNPPEQDKEDERLLLQALKPWKAWKKRELFELTSTKAVRIASDLFRHPPAPAPAVWARYGSGRRQGSLSLLSTSESVMPRDAR